MTLTAALEVMGLGLYLIGDGQNSVSCIRGHFMATDIDWLSRNLTGERGGQYKMVQATILQKTIDCLKCDFFPLWTELKLHKIFVLFYFWTSSNGQKSCNIETLPKIMCLNICLRKVRFY